jgi:RHH-type transcriptional regulator, proline utilization regulon repressor / proline dehydrogenase / delta 1-pyrroline-5-carboxylate dehydrogenase
MSAQRHAPTSAPTPLTDVAFQDEAEALAGLLPLAELHLEEKRQVDELARKLVHAARAGRKEQGGIDAFLTEYGLSTDEGVILMCLAEALLRIPDAATADDLIDDKIASGDWAKHMGHSGSLLVNASTWGLMLTGRVIGMKDASGLLGRLIGRTGEPVIRRAMRQAMRIMGDQFVLGRNIGEALERAKAQEALGYRYSYDMLGEAARTGDDATRYYQRYLDAIAAIGKAAGKASSAHIETLMTRPGLSIKLSAIHPRFEASQAARVKAELGERLRTVVRAAQAAEISLTVDAEESDRLELTLDVFEAALRDPALKGWHGLGLAVQAYGKRALPTLRRLAALSADSGHRIPVRLVKGAYWDSEIKWAQERGLPGYPVYTRKANTDVSYLACARYLLSERAAFYPQFATHNAQTVAALHTMAGDATYEFQRLHGMGEALYREVVPTEKLGQACRIYAPVGEHEDLLAYLVRRLLENGANTSFVNRLADDELPVAEIIRDPVEKARATEPKAEPRIPLPAGIFGVNRTNSAGLAHWDTAVRADLLAAMQPTLSTPLSVGPIIAGKEMSTANAEAMQSPHDRRVTIGRVRSATPEEVEAALAACDKGQIAWNRLGGEKRARILERAADLYEDNHPQLIATMVREGGKTLPNAMADLREAVDFLRYYGSEARRLFEAPTQLGGTTGERNELSLHGRGNFACISPWNFPIAIFTGQVAAALAAGNAALAKPAEQTPITAFLAVTLLHQAGVPGDVLHYLPGSGATVGAQLTKDPRTDGVVFTGSNDTAKMILTALSRRPGAIVPLIAETGGINAMIVDSSALPEQVVRDAVTSAFDSAGQRCSALRVLFVQEDIAPKVLGMLTGAMRELRLGDPLDYATDIGPVIDAEAKQTLDAHKSKMRREAKELLDLPMPEACRAGTFVTPAAYEISSIKVLERETFGPILHVVRYSRGSLDKVCDAINATGYGLTLGIHTRIDATAEFVADRVRAGNIYINRNQIGAVVGVQPFGGEGLSGTGPKAGGPNYLPRFCVERVRTTDTTASGGNASLLAAVGSG